MKSLRKGKKKRSREGIGCSSIITRNLVGDMDEGLHGRPPGRVFPGNANKKALVKNETAKVTEELLCETVHEITSYVKCLEEKDWRNSVFRNSDSVGQSHERYNIVME